MTDFWRSDQSRRREASSPSTANTASAVQIIENPITRGPLKDSPNTNTAHASCRLGAMYCRSPMVNKGMRRAPVANRTSGMAVSGPPNNKRRDGVERAVTHRTAAGELTPQHIARRERQQQQRFARETRQRFDVGGFAHQSIETEAQRQRDRHIRRSTRGPGEIKHGQRQQSSRIAIAPD